MASATQHPSFPARPYSSTFHGKLPERSAVSTFGASSNRDTARLERERSLREAQSQAAGGPSNPINNLTDEQRDEINEAVGHLLPQLLLYSKEWS
jgi:centrin-3